MTKPLKTPSDNQTLDMFSGVPSHDSKPLPPTVRRVVETAAEIMQDPPERADFLHAVLCQVGMPRKHTEGRVFERRSGSASMLLEAGRLWHRGAWKEQPLPYGTRPRLVMVHISGEAVRTGSRQIEIGDSMRDFLTKLGIDTSGGKHGGYTMFKKQMEALAACRLSLGMSIDKRDITINTQPISRFEAWLQKDGAQQVMWPGVLELSQEFFDTLVNHAVPLDHRALGALKHSALALDVYSWLAHRLYRVKRANGEKLSWGNLKEQFGQEYNDPKNFKKEMRQALRQVLAVYPDAKVEPTVGGIILKPSMPPIPKTQILTSR